MHSDGVNASSSGLNPYPRAMDESHPAMTPAPVPAAASAATRSARTALAAPETDGYLISTLELSAGLDVEPLALSALPNETLTELLRLRGRWPAAVQAFR